MPHVNTRIALAFAAPLAIAALTMAGCSDDDASDPGIPPASIAAANTPASTYTSPAAGPSSKAASAAASAGTGCPVTAATLEKAFKANPEIASALVLGKGLKDVSCYGGWATASTQPTNVDVAVVVFQYDAAKKTWKAVNGGTDGPCRDIVPEAAATHLKGCQN